MEPLFPWLGKAPGHLFSYFVFHGPLIEPTCIFNV
jgi:hypothetical protein